MKHLIKITFLLMAILLPTKALAHDFEVDGIYYDIIGNRSVSVTNRNADYNSYSGEVFIPETVQFNGVTYIVRSIGLAFYDCTDLKSVIIGDSVTSIGPSSFGGCYNLNSVVIGKSVIRIEGYAFCGCEKLTSIVFPNSLETIEEYAFGQCYSLKDIVFGNSLYFIDVTSLLDTQWYNEQPNGLVYAGLVAYHYKGEMPSGTNITIKDGTTVISGGVFYGCSGLQSIDIPESVICIGGRYETFHGCDNLSKVNIHSLESWCKINFVENPLAYAHHLFLNDIEIKDLIIPNTVTSISGCAFQECTCLVSASIPISVKNIGYYAFKGCSNLTNIEIPNSVTQIGNMAFDNCNNINTLIITGEGEWQGDSIPISHPLKLYLNSQLTSVKGINITPISVYSYASTPPKCDERTFLDFSGTLHVPATSLAAYFTAPYWSNFSNIIGDAVEPIDISIDKDSIEIFLGTQFNLTATITPENATPSDIEWNSNNVDVAIVTNGTLTAVGIGECDIFAQCLNKVAVCHVTVTKPGITIVLDQQEAMVLPNHIITLTPSASPILPELAVTSSDPTVAAARVMNGKVQVVGVKEGTSTITVGSADGTAVPATCLVTVYTESGDANCDGFVNISDVTATISYILNEDPTEIKLENADYNNDGTANISDVIELINLILNSPN